MKTKSVKLNLPEGVFDTQVLIFDSSDKKELYRIYKNWRALCDDLTKLESRSVNLPEGLSESAFCIAMGVVRVTRQIYGANTSFDCFDLKTNRRIQVKACSVIPDLTSFGPKSVWDDIYFVDFYRKGNWDGTFDIYLIDTNDIYSHKVNKNKTLKEQQAEGRRPRFKIYTDIIQAKGLKPIKTFDLK